MYTIGIRVINNILKVDEYNLIEYSRRVHIAYTD